MELYSGQGRISLAKRNPDGTKQKRFFLGNCPNFRTNFLTGEISISVDEIRPEMLEIVCGSIPRKVDTLIIQPGDGEPSDIQATAMEYEINDSIPFEYELSFEGFNVATGDSTGNFPQWRVYLYRVTLTSGEGWDFISDQFAVVKISGMAHKDELHNNKRGIVQRIHRESTTGLRLQDMRMDKATV